ncbi:uncharacterized protein LOC143955547 isoform X2 [Lithobates pipiens]
MRMEEDQSHMTEKILNLTLEIIYLLTGERFPLVKSGDHMTITVPPCDSLKPERHNMEKILEVTKKMMELLTGEVPIRCQDVTVYFSMEEWEYLEGHKDLYNDVMMDTHEENDNIQHDQDINISIQEEYEEKEGGVVEEPSDGHKDMMDPPSNRNSPERCSSPPLYSRDSTQEDHTIPHHHQSGNLRDDNLVKEVHIEGDEKDGGTTEILEGHKDVAIEPPINKNPPERCPRPLYSRDSTQEDHTIPHHHQSGNLRDSEVDAQEEFKMADEQYRAMKEFFEGNVDLYKDVMMGPQNTGNPPERCPSPLYSRDSTQEGHTIPHHHQSGNLNAPTVEVKEQMKEKADEGGVIKKVNKNLFQDTTVKLSRHRDPPERPRHPRQEDHSYARPYQGEVEETYVRDGQQYTKEAGMTRTFIEEDTPTEISTGHAMEKPSKDRLTLSPGCRMEDEDITGDCGGEKTMISTMDGGLHSADRPQKPSDSEQPRTVGDGAKTQEKTFPCAECGESFSSGLALFIHQGSHKPSKLLTCSECGKYFLHKSQLVTHQRTHTGEKPYSCLRCGKCFAQKSSLVIHERSHTGEKPFSCPECGKCFSNKPVMLEHQICHTGEHPFSCPECGKGFRRKRLLEDHIKCHTGETTYSCPECGKGFRQKGNLNYHIKCHTREKPYSCPKCGKCFLRKSRLDLHQKSHTRENTYSCSECRKCFVSEEALVLHQRSHTGEMPYGCLECGKRFSQKSVFYSHRRVHTGEKPHACPECGKCFRRQSFLNHHIKIHTGEKPYDCLVCGKRFSLKRSLVVHQKRHTGEKPYCCPECGKSFSCKSGADRHRILRHTQRQPLPCSECGKCYLWKSDLAKHQKSHIKEKPHSCSECGKRFLLKSNLTRHQRTHTAL